MTSKNKKPQHSPGPWVAYQPPYSDQMQIRDKDEEMVYAVVPLRGNKQTRRADAALIAAAPDMKKALGDLMLALAMAPDGNIDELENHFDGPMKAALLAIAKAEGGEG